MDPSPPDTAENVPVPPYTDVYALNSVLDQLQPPTPPSFLQVPLSWRILAEFH